ncbi:MAG: S41 family peptidase [Rhodobacteraceae bacterium]|nr:S41 family peptidase [Paracoccaceae bacterium]
MRSSHTCFGIMLAATLLTLSLPVPAQEEEETIELSTYENLSLFSEILTRIQEDYVEEVNETELIQAAINGMLLSLDPHSSYIPDKRYSSVQERTSGQFGGLGIEVTMENGFVRVISPIDDTPAAEAGLQAGDFITGIDGETVMGMTLDQAVKRLRGEPGSAVTLTIDREEEEAPFDVEITRAIIKISSTDIRAEGRSLVVRVKVFNRQSVTGIIEGVEDMITGGKPLASYDGVVLDLRNNPGGLLDVAIDVTDLFLDSGEIVSVRNRADSWQSYDAKSGDILDGIPIVVLINGGSASASEIVAGALQDHNRAVVVGTQSFGKGSVQSVFRLGERFGGMQLTTARYYTPSGRSIQGNGITPDIIIQHRLSTPTPDDDEPIEEFYSESDLPNSLETIQTNQEIEASETRAEEEVSREELIRNDPQLATALDILRSLAVLKS